MKLLLLVVAVVVLLWLLRGTLSTWRGDRPDRAKRDAKPPSTDPQAMLPCAECGLHLPKGDALPGQGGVFCSAAHRAAHESRLARRDDAG